jgi:hypothetical protein
MASPGMTEAQRWTSSCDQNVGSDFVRFGPDAGVVNPDNTKTAVG